MLITCGYIVSASKLLVRVLVQKHNDLKAPALVAELTCASVVIRQSLSKDLQT